MLQNGEVALRHSVDGQSDFTGRAQMTRLSTVLLALASVLVGFVAPVQAENVVRWATPTPAETFDPHGHAILFTYWVQRQVYEALIDYDRDGRLEPKLATSWKRLDSRTWEVELRHGVVFHDGTPLTSADVVFRSNAPKPGLRRSATG
jgi:peptide/nickel transport system substrate-binding protein